MREFTITELKPLFEEFGLGPNVRNLTLVREIARLRAERDVLRKTITELTELSEHAHQLGARERHEAFMALAVVDAWTEERK